MRWSRGSVVFFVVVALAVAGGLVVGVGDSGADHGATTADYTVEPMAPEDRQPGATDVRYGQVVVAQAGVDLETLEEMRAVYEEGSWARCGPEDGEVWGIDRGNTHDGYEIDEGLEENTRSFSTGEDVFEVQLYGEEDLGASTYLDDGDAVVSVAKCMDNPAEPGWYQISGSVTGVTTDGERRTFSSDSHYFWICDCRDEAEAREELGPPPSEPEPTPTPTADEPETDETAEEDADGSGDEPGGGTDGNGSTEEAATASIEGTRDAATADGDADADADSRATDGPAGTPTPTGSASAADGPTPTPPVPGWEHSVVDTPTPGDGAGPGPEVIVVALAVAGLLFRWRQ